MATNNQVPAEGQDNVQAPGALVDIAKLREEYKTSWPVFAGVCAQNDWKPGKAVTKAVYKAAVDKFSKAAVHEKGDK